MLADLAASLTMTLMGMSAVQLGWKLPDLVNRWWL